MVTGGDTTHRGADALHDAGAFVTEDAWQGEGEAPGRAERSVWHRPVATMRTSTSSARGSSSWIVSSVNGAPAARTTAATVSVVMALLPDAGSAPRQRAVELIARLQQRGAELLLAAREAADSGPGW